MNIALLGFGVVGGGVYELCRERSDLRVTRVLVRRDRPEIAAIATRNIEDIVSDPAVDVVAEVMGGIHPAKEYVEAALRAGKHVVTANKALIAACGSELIALARDCGAALRCTAAVGGGIPWLVNLERVKRLDTVSQVGGIMNGTTNFIMDAMHRAPVAFADVLKKAQELGYAEADPSADIDGDDIRRKLAISAAVAFDAAVEETAIPTFGIRTVTDGDIAAFRRHGFTCKLLAAALRCQEGVCAYVEPTLVGQSDLESAVPANFNLITYTGDAIGRQSFFGQGAGRFPTAGNVVQDCLDILEGKRAFYGSLAERAVLVPDAEAHPYYVRTAAADAWLSERTVDDWGAGVVTRAVAVGEMLAWARRQLERDPGCFVAGIR
ncbi:MAG: homoserine dehydrogenase [Oscillospiraceae bacterium]|nr:homoserine dehydrogenase [Oscillospiraceae bacterium]